MSQVLLIDNLDSFSFNLVESFERLGCKVQVLRSTTDPGTAFAAARHAHLIVISPGPGRPEEAGCSMPLIRLSKGKIPLLGICLGHQAIIAEAGGTVNRATRIVHGKSSLIEHDGSGPFFGLQGPVRVGRYHSLGSNEVPPRFRVHAWCEDLAMAISDDEALQTGLQFHPESILTPMGDRMLANVLEARR